MAEGQTQKQQVMDRHMNICLRDRHVNMAEGQTQKQQVIEGQTREYMLKGQTREYGWGAVAE